MTLPEVEELEFENGFRALLVRRPALPVVASVLWYRVGSRDERTGETGVSHFLEHMMFKGTDRYVKGEIDQLTAKMGGSNNAWTDNDATAYYFSLASDRWEAALEIEASRMRSCSLEPHEFASEKEVVLQELRMGEDDPWRPLFQQTESLMFQVHPYHNPIIGYAEDLERLEVAGMRAYYDRCYGPNRAFLVVVGDIDIDHAKARIAELFGVLPMSSEPRREVLAEPQQAGERRAVMSTNYQVARMCMGWPTCRMGERDDYALDLLSHALGNGKNSQLYKRLVLEEELVTYIGCYNETRQDPGVFMVLAELREGVDRARVESIVHEEIDKIVRKGIGQRDLQRIRAQIRASFLFQDETALDLAQKIARFEAMTPRGYKTLEGVLPTYDSLASKELQEVARRYFRSERATTVWSVPEEKPAERRSGRAAGKKAAGSRSRKQKGPAKKAAAKKVEPKKKASKKPAKPAANKKSARASAGTKDARKAATKKLPKRSSAKKSTTKTTTKKPAPKAKADKRARKTR